MGPVGGRRRGAGSVARERLLPPEGIMIPSTGRKSLVLTVTVAPICGTGTSIRWSSPVFAENQPDTGEPSAGVRTTL